MRLERGLRVGVEKPIDRSETLTDVDRSSYRDVSAFEGTAMDGGTVSTPNDRDSGRDVMRSLLGGPARRALWVLASLLGACSDELSSGEFVLLDVTSGDVVVLAEVSSDTGRDAKAEVGDAARDVSGAETDASLQGECPGGFGCACESPLDCATGFCVPAGIGGVCSKSCVDDCPSGYTCKGITGGRDLTYVCVPLGDSLCHGCLADADCEGPGARCVPDLAGAGRCGRACSSSNGCPKDFDCLLEANAPLGAQGQCRPTTGFCPCIKPLVGTSQPCVAKNDFGSCTGLQTCTATGWAGCDAPPPMLELCNGHDDDCDATTDEGFPDTDADKSPDCLDLDDDADGIADDQDNCALVANAAQENLDLDAQGDACDLDDDNDFSPDTADCQPNDPQIHPGATEACNGKDDDCNGTTDDGAFDTDSDTIPDCQDLDDDGDGVPDTSDLCPLIADPGQENLDLDGLGDACDPDDDNDLSADAQDCEPKNPAVHPGAAEVCNGKDDDCTGKADDGAADLDADGLADCVDPDDDADGILDGADNCPVTANADQANFDLDPLGDACDPDDDNDFSADASDCKPFDPLIHPNAGEPCDGVDNDCSGVADDGAVDLDQDGLPDCVDPDDDGDGVADAKDNCPVTANAPQDDLDLDGQGDACDPDDDGDLSADAADCKPLDPTVHPGAAEVCNGKDDDCNDIVDDGSPDTDLDGIADCLDTDDDDDQVLDGVDDCPLVTDPLQENFDLDPQGDACDPDDDNDLSPDAVDCQPKNPSIHPSALEACNGLDDDCDGTPDDGFTDLDLDGLADCLDSDDDEDGVADAIDNCPVIKNTDQANFDLDTQGDACDPDDDNDLSPDGADCEPFNPQVHPGALDVCNGKDDDCNQTIDDGALDSDQDGLPNCVDPDDDGDQVDDDKDNCPLVANGGQEDFDLDTTGDACDPDDDNDLHADGADCQPKNPAVHPGAPEICNGVDDDCNQTIDDGALDLDQDQISDCIDTDDDADGILDVADNCPLTPNAGQEDLDQDGLGDACDGDRDGDGIANAVDNCPNTSNPTQANQDGDGQGDACDDDRDGDGIANVTDVCPDVPDPAQLDTDKDGQGDACDTDDDGDGDPDGTDCAPLNALVGHGLPESCNQTDDDCDGTVDDGNNGCGGACALSGTLGAACDGADADLCTDDQVVCTGLNTTGCAAGADTAEQCNGTDDDCDGQVDEGCTCTITKNAGQTYFLCTDFLPWTGARDACGKLGAKFVSITSAAENAFLVNATGAISKEKWWIGLNDRSSEGTFVWDSGEAVTYKNWHSGEPNNQGNEDCTQLWRYTDGTWNDEPCASAFRYVCEQ